MSKDKKDKKAKKAAAKAEDAVVNEAPEVTAAEDGSGDEGASSPRSSDKKRKPVNDELEPEEEALSRKERRKRRKLEAAGLAPEEIEAAVGKKSDVAAESTTSPAKGQTPAKQSFGVWIGNLNFKTTSKELVDWLSSKGIPDVTRINMPSGKKAHENNRGFAYVDFATEPEMQIAIGLSEEHLDGRKLLIKASTDFTGRPASAAAPIAAVAGVDGATAVAAAAVGGTLSKTQRKILNQQKNPPAPCLFFGNLGFETTQDDIKQMIDAHHEASQLWKPKAGKKKTSRSKKSKGKAADSDQDAESDDGESESDSEKEETVMPPTTTSGIRKVRLGTFEDSGKCKGWAFVDFHTAEQATAVLVDARNHRLNGRNLVVEFASAEAVRRGALGTRSAVRQRRQERNDNGDGDAAAAPAFKRQKRMTDEDVARNARSMAHNENVVQEDQRPRRQPRQDFDSDRKASKPAVRAKPGAALATAARASQAIVQSKGKKIVFD